MSGKYFHMEHLVLNSNYNVKMIMTNNLDSHKYIKDHYPKVTIITSFDEAIYDKTIDLVVIATSNDVHYEYSKKALINNKHVVCEKPFVETKAQALELFNLARVHNRVLRVFHNRMYDGDFLTIKDLLARNTLGKLISYTARFDNFNPDIGPNWRFKDSHMAGLFYDLAPHLIHQALMLFGEPKSVFTKLYYDRANSLVDDRFEITMNYDNNFTAYLSGEFMAYKPKPRFEIKGQTKAFYKYGFDTPDNIKAPSDTHYQEEGTLAEIIDTNQTDTKVKVLRGIHYEFYNKLANDITESNTHSIENDLAISVINIMEKGILSNKFDQAIQIK